MPNHSTTIRRCIKKFLATQSPLDLGGSAKHIATTASSWTDFNSETMCPSEVCAEEVGYLPGVYASNNRKFNGTKLFCNNFSIQETLSLEKITLVLIKHFITRWQKSLEIAT